jgi:hypothetical protein
MQSTERRSGNPTVSYNIYLRKGPMGKVEKRAKKGTLPFAGLHQVKYNNIYQRQPSRRDNEVLRQNERLAQNIVAKTQKDFGVY